ncbi:MAG: outer membrane protein TolC [Verrucomicrobiaceae bacterium]|nr:outer membrane protein TolC [Verrucomicrobiaceae bacterium]
MFVHSFRYALLALTAGLVCVLSGCTGNFHKRWADREVFGILRSKASKVPNSGDELFDINAPAPLSLEKLKRNFTTADFLGDKAYLEKDARVLTLADALQYGVERNRTYLDQKETVYLAALDLTGVRHQYALLPVGKGEAGYASDQAINSLITQNTFSSNSNVGFSALQSTGAKLVTNFTSDVLRYLGVGGRGNGAGSTFAASIAQPLLRGAGSLTVTEPLTQAERDVIYSIRDFTQYRKTFAISVTSQYYKTLQARAVAHNAFLAFQAFKKMLPEQAELTAANRPGRTLTSLGLLQQAKLTYNRNWLNAVRNYEVALDDLKITLGLPVNQRILLEQKELEKLELINPHGTLDEAMKTALTTRLDLWNERDSLADAERHVKVAKQDLLPTLDVTAGYTAAGNRSANAVRLSDDHRNFQAGLNLDLHLDQTPVRNDLRAAQIAEQKARRTLDLAEENVRKDVRTSWRNLELARQQYGLAQESIKLNTVRLAREESYDAEGRNQARDLIDAQAALISAYDDLGDALVNHTIARIQFWKDMGILFIKKDGRWEDVLAKESPRGKHD